MWHKPCRTFHPWCPCIKTRCLSSTFIQTHTFYYPKYLRFSMNGFDVRNKGRRGGGVIILHWRTWWRHRMETFCALLAICAGNSPVSGEFPTQRPVTRSFDVFFDLCPNERLSKHSWGWRLETQSSPLWRHSNVFSDSMGQHCLSSRCCYSSYFHNAQNELMDIWFSMLSIDCYPCSTLKILVRRSLLYLGTKSLPRSIYLAVCSIWLCASNTPRVLLIQIMGGRQTNVHTRLINENECKHACDKHKWWYDFVTTFACAYIHKHIYIAAYKSVHIHAYVYAYKNTHPPIYTYYFFHLQDFHQAVVCIQHHTSNGSWCIGIKGEMSGTVCVTFTWDIYIYMSCL